MNESMTKITIMSEELSNKLPQVEGRTQTSPRGRPKTSARCGFRRRKPFIGIPRLPPITGARKSTLERLAKPTKPRDKLWLGDKPSVYWLDYIIDPTPHQIKDPKQLAAYYDTEFMSKFPRTRRLATPKTRKGEEEEEEYESVVRLETPGREVPLSALTYEPTTRISQLARPKTVTPKFKTLGEIEQERLRKMVRKSTAVLSLPPMTPMTLSRTSSRPDEVVKMKPSSASRVKFADSEGNKIDYSRGDFSPTTKVNYHRLATAKGKKDANNGNNSPQLPKENASKFLKALYSDFKEDLKNARKPRAVRGPLSMR